MEDIQHLITRRRDLKRKIREITHYYKKEENKVLLDYSRRKFSITTKVKKEKIGIGRSKQKSEFLKELFVLAVERMIAYLSYNKQKEGKL